MQRYAESVGGRRKELARRRRQWHRDRPPNKTAGHAPYGDRVAASPDVNRARFARFVRRTLDLAHDRGMTDHDIHDATGVPSSTFHRWARGDFRTAPSITRVRQFCDGLGADPRAAMAALGFTDERTRTEPEPDLPPEIRVILRRLADPNVSDAEKALIHEMLAMLAARADRPPRRRNTEAS